MRRAPPVVAWSFFCIFACNGQVVFERSAPAVIEAREQVPPASFTEALVLRLSRRFLAAHRTTPLVRYVVCTEKVDCRTDPLRGKPTDWDFETWKQAYLREPANPPAAAEMIRIQRRAAVRIRFSDGRIVERVLEGTSPYVVTVRNRRGKLLAVQMIWHADPAKVETHFFVQTPAAWDKGTAEELQRRLSGAGLPVVNISINEGWCFVMEDDYPIYNRFLPRLPPPSRAQYRSYAGLYCGENTCS